MAERTDLTALLLTLSTPPPSLSTSSLLYHRLTSLLELQAALNHLTKQRDHLGTLLARHVHASEDAVATSVSVSGTGMGMGMGAKRRASTAGKRDTPKPSDKEDTESVFISHYSTSVASFDAFLTQHSLGPPPSSSPSWITHPSLPPHSPTTVPTSLRHLLDDPATLGAGIATLEGSALSSLLVPTAETGQSALEVLVRVLLADKGGEAVLELMLGAWEMGVREVVGREESELGAGEGSQSHAGGGGGVGVGVGLGLGEGVGLGLGLGLGLGGVGDGAPRERERERERERVGQGGGREREKELESFLVGSLEVVEGMGSFIHPSRSPSFNSNSTPSPSPSPSTPRAPNPPPPPPPPTKTTTTSTGPLLLTRSHESTLLTLLSSSRSLRAPPPSPNPAQAPSSPTPNPKSPLSNSGSSSSHWSTLARARATETISSLSAYPMAGLSTLANGASSVLPSSPIPSAFYSPSPSPSPSLPPPPPSTSIKAQDHDEDEDDRPPPLPPKPPSSSSSNSPSSFSPLRFSPSQFLPSPSFEQQKDPLDPLLRRAAAELLRSFTPQAAAEGGEGGGGEESQPLVQVLIARLLSSSFPAPPPSPTPTAASTSPSLASDSNNRASSSHRKILLLAVIRWWAFTWLGSKLGRLGLGGCTSAPSTVSGVVLSPGAGSALGSAASGGEAASEGRRRPPALLDEIWLAEEEGTRLGRGVQRVIYRAVVEACGVGSGSGSGAGAERSGEDEVRSAARGFVEGWSCGSSGGGREGAAAGGAAGRFSAFALSPSEYHTLITSFGPLVLRSPFPFPSSHSNHTSPIRRPPSTASPSAPHLNWQQNGATTSSTSTTTASSLFSVSSANSNSPTISMSFKRSTAFGSATPSPSATAGARSSTPSSSSSPSLADEGGRATESRLGERVEEVLEGLEWIARGGGGGGGGGNEEGMGMALLFALVESGEGEEGKEVLRISERLPGWEEVARARAGGEAPLPSADANGDSDGDGDGGAATKPKTTRPPPLLRSRSSPSYPSTDAGGGGWISPPRSPRHEALRLAMERPLYPYSTTPHHRPAPSPASTIKEDPFLSFALGGGGIAGALGVGRSHGGKMAINGREEKGSVDPTEQEMDLLRRGLFSLARTRSIILGPGQTDLLPLLSSASARSLAEEDYPSYILYDQTASILRYYEERGLGCGKVAEWVVEPLKEEMRRREEEERALRGWLGRVEEQRMGLVERAREERGELNDLRIRAWYASIKRSPLGLQLRSRLSELYSPRTSRQLAQARSSLSSWRKELGIYSFTRPEEGDTTFDEALMLVETAVAVECQPEMVFNSAIWRREKEVLQGLIVAHEEKEEQESRPSFAESLLASGSSILAAPLSLAGLPLPSSPAIPSSTATTTESQPTTPLTILSFGACTPTLLKPHESPTPSPSAIEDFLLRLQLKLAAYLWSDLSSNLISPRNHEGRLCGSDAWFGEFASPLSPLPRPEEREVRKGVRAVPRAYLPTTPTPPDYLIRILERFAQHPSPHAKMHALLELELVLSATMSAPLSAQGVAARASSSSTNSSTSLPPTERAKGYLSKLTSLLPARDRTTTRISLSPRPIVAVLEDEPPSTFASDLFSASTSTDGEDKPPSLSDNPRRRSRSTSRPLSLTSSTSDIPSLLPTLLDFSSPSTSTSPLSPATPLPPAPLTTDALLLTLESLLLHALPSLPALFQSLQIVASLTPSAILDHHVLGKAFWDTAGAALSLKREVVEGEFGVVERATRALSEGTEEGRELAERLVKIAAREESEVALSLLGSMGLPHQFS